jgi:hypothetical protein
MFWIGSMQSSGFDTYSHQGVKQQSPGDLPPHVLRRTSRITHWLRRLYRTEGILGPEMEGEFLCPPSRDLGCLTWWLAEQRKKCFILPSHLLESEEDTPLEILRTLPIH